MDLLSTRASDASTSTRTSPNNSNSSAPFLQTPNKPITKKKKKRGLFTRHGSRHCLPAADTFCGLVLISRAYVSENETAPSPLCGSKWPFNEFKWMSLFRLCLGSRCSKNTAKIMTLPRLNAFIWKQTLNGLRTASPSYHHDKQRDYLFIIHLKHA